MKTLLLLSFCAATSLVRAGEPRAVRAALVPMADRKPAPAFILRNAAGKAARNSDYRGKVVLLDFWATECGGCKLEIPGFIGLQREYKSKGVTAVGISMDILYENLKSDEEGWGRVNPFVKSEGVNYPIVMGDDAVSKAYNIQAMPATYLLDKQGRIAATYIGIVNQVDIETNLKKLIAE